MADVRRATDYSKAQRERGGQHHPSQQPGEREARPARPVPTGPLGGLNRAGAVEAAPPTPFGLKRSRGFGTVLRNPYFLRLWMAQLISQTIMNAANYGLIILVSVESAQNGGSFTAAAGAIVAFSLPALLFGAPAGVLVDRFDRRLVLWVSNVLRALAAVAFVISLVNDRSALLPVYLLAFFIAMVGQFFAPAEGAAIPQLVRDDELIHALSLFNITFTIAQAAGLIVLGPAILSFVPPIYLGTARHGFTLTPVESLFIIIAVLYVLCAGLILTIPGEAMRAPKRPQRRLLAAESSQIRRMAASIWEAMGFVRRDPHLLISICQLAVGGTVVAIIAMVAPRFVVEFFNRPPELAALVFVPAGAGLVIGSAITPNVARRLQYNRTIAIGVIVLAASAGLMAVVRAVAPTLYGSRDFYNAPLYLGVMLLLTFLIGIALDFVNVPAQTVMQEHAPDWIKGRVLAVQAMALNGLTVPAVLLMGRTADRIGLMPAILLLAAIIAVVGLISVYFGVQSDRKAAREATHG